jgi:hypothetical protein
VLHVALPTIRRLMPSTGGPKQETAWMFVIRGVATLEVLINLSLASLRLS